MHLLYGFGVVPIWPIQTFEFVFKETAGVAYVGTKIAVSSGYRERLSHVLRVVILLFKG